MNEIITLECPSCGGQTVFSADTEILTCEYCGNRHTFRLPNPTTGDTPAGTLGAITAPNSAPSISGQGISQLRPRPKEVTLQKQGDRLELSWRWFSWKFLPLAFFCVAWDSFLCFWYSIAFTSGAPWIMIVFPVAHLAVGAGLTYYTLAGFLNRSQLVVDRSTFSVSHGPLPWLGSLRVPITQVEQLYCKEKPGKKNSGPTYQLSVILKDGRKKDLLSNLDSPEIGFYIEHQIENWLKIPNRPVRGEISPDIANN
jgi:hypothetical protein